jgi:alkaline phosphatase D
MKFTKAILWVGLLMTGLASHAQNTFTHSTEGAIDSSYFNPSLAPFYHGVASGDPLQDRVIIWTRVTPEKDTIIPVKWYVATDTSFKNIVQQGQTATDYTKDYTVKVDVSGLEPGNTYFYYFEALHSNSIIGRTRTLPTTTTHLRMAVVSCANYQMGYFNAYQRLAERSDLDAVIHLGDYIYEYATFGYGWTSTVNRTHAPDNELRSMDDYRIRHSYYKLDPNLRAAHQQHPFIVVWDDHEIVNNAHTTGTSSLNDHNPLEDGDFDTRKKNAVTAYLEWMPIREQKAHSIDAPIYRQFTFGSLMDLYMVDTRLADRSAQVVNSSDPRMNDTTRTILGARQRQWLFDNMSQSNAQWQVIGNQVMFSQLDQAFKLDSWVGYPYEREKIKNHFVGRQNKNLVILTGDTHRSWAFDLADEPFNGSYQPNTGNGTFGVEFCTPSLASPNMDESNSMAAVNTEEAATLASNSHLRFIDLDRHGYFILDVTPLKVQADYFYGPTQVPSTTESFGSGWFSYNQQGYLNEALAPAPAKAGSYTLAPQNPLAYTVGLLQHKPTQEVLFIGAYPNPVGSLVNVGLSVNQESTVTLKLLTVDGKLAQTNGYQLHPGNHKIELPVHTLGKGAYVLQVLVNGQPLYQKQLIKQ